MTEWIRCRRSSPCPICGKPDGCSVAADGTEVSCSRVESDKLIGVPFHGGWIHTMTDGQVVSVPQRQRKREKAVHREEMVRLAIQYHENARGVVALAERLGVTWRSLDRLQVGWDGKCHTFPSRNEHEVVIGISLRAASGQKWMVVGSHPGLYWPEGVDANSTETLFLPEGPTDTAVLLDMELAAMGRPANCGGVEIITAILKRRRRQVVIVADHDAAKSRPDGSVWYPGMFGAKRLAVVVKPLAISVRIVKSPRHKDVRAWRQDGLTRDVFLSTVHHMQNE